MVNAVQSSKKVRAQIDGKWVWLPESEVPADAPVMNPFAGAKREQKTVAASPEPAVADEGVTLTRADYDALMGLVARLNQPAEPVLPTAGVDADGYAIVAPPREAALGDDAKAWRAPDGKTYRHWYSPEFPDITLRPHPNHVIQFRGGAYTPINAREDEYLRDWIWRQRGKNDPELWHGDTPAFDSADMPDLECEYCHRFTCRNQHVMAAHKTKKHNREDLAEHPFIGFSPALIRAGRITPRHQ